MDVHTTKCVFPAAPVMGRNFLTPRHPGVRVRNVRRNFRPKSLCPCCFFFPQSCADRPGFSGVGCGWCPGSQLRPGASIVAPNWHLLQGPLDICLDMLPTAPPPTHAKPVRTAQVFATQGGTYRQKLVGEFFLILL